MSKKLLLIEMAVAVTIVILEALIEEADKLSSEQNNSLSPIVSPFAEKRSLRFGPIALAVLCLFFSLVTILLWFARFFEPVTGSKLFVHSMNVLHFFYCVAMVASSSLEVLKFYGLNLKHFSYAPLILACAVVILVTIELLYFLFTASRAEATTNASRTVGAANASSNMGAANGFPRTADAVELSFGPTPSQLRSARAVTYSLKKSVKVYY